MYIDLSTGYSASKPLSAIFVGGGGIQSSFPRSERSVDNEEVTNERQFCSSEGDALALCSLSLS